ncbi:hypothetical protein L1987_10637 [Smallanthus sonchifolius]|uniref:Uncharacterized protein n=1 Tax=Smallanthus sonchifolius TaxID=185202 RepID=A0ACB9J959_9ASTR|nr:hypothetical protein L1987_10637 [Smallanthus sonchifolius]
MITKTENTLIRRIGFLRSRSPPSLAVVPSCFGLGGGCSFGRVMLEGFCCLIRAVPGKSQIRVPDSTVGGRDSLLRTSGSIRASAGSPISTGQRVIRRPKIANRYSPHLSELRVNEFVQETSELIDRRKGGGTHLKSGKNLCDGGGLGFAPNDGRDLHLGEVDSEVADPLPSPGNTPNLVNLPSHSEANEIGHSISLMTGDTPVIDTEMEGLSQPSSPVDSEMEGPKFASVTADYGSYSTLRDTSDVQTLPVSQSGIMSKSRLISESGVNSVEFPYVRNGFLC